MNFIYFCRTVMSAFLRNGGVDRKEYVYQPLQPSEEIIELHEIDDDLFNNTDKNNLQIKDETNESEESFTVEEAINHLGFGPFQIQLIGLVGMCSMADAMEVMMLSIIAPELRCVWKLPRWQEALITTVVFVGQFFGASLWGQFCDKFGRKKGLIACSIWIFYYGLLSSIAPNYVWFLCMRMLAGFGIAGGNQGATLNSEFLPSNVRGKCLALMGSFFAIGSIGIALLALVTMSTLGWRWMLALSGIPLACFILMSRWLPESARYCMLCGKTAEAYYTLMKVARLNKKSMPPGFLKPIEAAPRGKYSDMFETKEMGITTILLFYIWFTAAFAYYGLVLFTTEFLTKTVDNTCSRKTLESLSRGCNFWCERMDTQDYIDFIKTTFAEFVGIFFNIVVVDILGRKRTLSLVCMLFCVFSSLQFFCLSRTNMVIFLFCARGSVSAIFNVVFIYTPEVYPTTIRGLALGTCSTVARVGAIVTPFIAQVLMEVSPTLAIGIYAGSALLASICALLLPIETTGRSMKNKIDIIADMDSEQEDSEDEI
ncbi:synaptic vesicle 2-related protein-like [Anneissia japonica]|uniref:synaptic vesicle 2-related protein-like n=1 Tax=Anneissia japonica TaxID=1529436 RepID=UPI001425966E|nr:synaptic vesicle 2-related protein-like [Anneissia japonica]